MNFITFCSHKDCRKEMSPVVDKETNEAYCSICDRKIDTVSEFMRRQLRAFGNVRQTEKKKSAYSVKCETCGTTDTPDLKATTVEEGGKKVSKEGLFCRKCSAEIKSLSKPFAQTIKSLLKTR